ncbi:hypothetical protein [Natrinema limicola]|nr:hypothetical protein [Natrinema limicola]
MSGRLTIGDQLVAGPGWAVAIGDGVDGGIRFERAALERVHYRRDDSAKE